MCDPAVHAAVTSNTYAIYGNGQEKELTELVPGILNQLGPDSLASLRKMAESYNAGRAVGGKDKEPEDDDDGVPDLVESFEVDDKKSGEAASADPSANKLEEVSVMSSRSSSCVCGSIIY
jgi:nascent polypeptide-associated complex subunit beta